MSLLLNMLSRLVITFLPRSKHQILYNLKLYEFLGIYLRIYLSASCRGEGGGLSSLPRGDLQYEFVREDILVN